LSLFVLDASVALGWLVDYPAQPLATQIQRRLTQGDRALVPAFFHLEVSNGLAVAEKRGVLTLDKVDLCLVKIEAVLHTAVDTRTDLVTVRQATMLGRAYGLSPYDAVYLRIAQLENIPLATLDNKLASAAERVGVPVIR
jgi:predicted nucleic acid-binding protein